MASQTLTMTLGPLGRPLALRLRSQMSQAASGVASVVCRRWCNTPKQRRQNLHAHTHVSELVVERDQMV